MYIQPFGPRRLGAVLYRFVLATATTLFLDARRWAGYFCVLCGLACVKSVLALAFGHVAVPRLVVTDRRLVFEFLCLLDGISILTFAL